MSRTICKSLKSISMLIKPRTEGFGSSFFLRRENTSATEGCNKDVAEIQIPVPWGHISGKWWGDQGVPPVLAIHGWQDNANSFDRLIPLLNLPSVLAIDLPGHGRSSHFPEGFPYDLGENLLAVHRVINHYKWEKVPLLTHSFGAALGFAYTAIFPKQVKWLINIECIRSVLASYKAECCLRLSASIDHFFKIEGQKKSQAKPSYKISQLVSMSIEGSMGSISNPEAAMVLLERVTDETDTPPSSKTKISSDLEKFLAGERLVGKYLPKEEQAAVEKFLSTVEASLLAARENLKNFSFKELENKYYTLARDPTIRVFIFHAFDREFLVQAAKNIKTPILSVRTQSGFLLGAGKGVYDKTLEIIQGNGGYFEHHDIEGTHHVHLIRPESVAELINNFLKKQ